MPRIKPLLLIAAVLLVLAAGVRGCAHRRAEAVGASAVRPQPASAATAPTSSAPTSPGVDDAATAAALDEASGVLHRYLQLAGAARWDEADALWAPHRVPDGHDEDGLRDRMPVRALKIRNRLPEPLDDARPPTRVRVVLRLDMNGRDRQPHHYEGEYRLRRDDVTRQWQLVSARLHEQPAR